MKTRVSFTWFLSIPIALALSSAAPAGAAPALLGLWRFDEANGDTANDSSGLGWNGALLGENGNVPARVQSQPGFGGALRFTNNSVDHAFVDIPANPLLKIGMTAENSWTIAIWANEASDGFGNFVATYGRLFAFDGGFGLNFESGANGDAEYWIWHGSVSAWQQGVGTDAAVVPLLDQWTHLALVYDGTNVTLYRNGNQGAQGAKTALPARSSVAFPGYSGSIQIGAMPNMGGDRNWNGMLDDFAVFRGALTEAEVRTIMAGDFSAYIGGGRPRIVVHPQDLTVNQGLDATFSVVATSDGAAGYQWRFHGTNLPGATKSSLTLTNVQDSQAGTYTVVVSNTAGPTSSRDAVLTVLVPLPPRLVGLWRFDEGSGDQARDSSGLTNHGVIIGENGNTPTWVSSRPGFGTALQFQNNGVDHAYVDIPASDSLRIGLASNDAWTITVWAKELSDGAGNYVATYGRFLAQDGGLGMEWDSGASGDSQFYVWHNSLTAWHQGFGTAATVVPQLDQWIHLALVYDGRSLTLYRNGNQGPQGAKTSLPLSASLSFTGYAGAIQIGSQLNMDGTRNWNGLLDDVAIFAGALSESHLRTVMSGDYSSFLNLAPLLSVGRNGNRVVVSWGLGTLQSTTNAAGGWQDESGAVSPLIIIPADARRFYRVRR